MLHQTSQISSHHYCVLPHAVYFILLVFLGYNTTYAQTVIPNEQTVNWSASGIALVPPPALGWVNVLDYGAPNDGSSNCHEAITASIAALNGQAGVVYFPEGDYLLQNTVNLPSGVILRGESAEESRILLDMASSGTHGFTASGGAASSFISLLNAPQKGDTQLQVTNTSSYNVGDYLELLEDNDPVWDTSPISWAANSKGQIVRIAAIEGNNLQLEQAIRINYSLPFNPRVRVLTPAQHIGIECLYLERLADVSTGSGYNIRFTHVANSWVSGIHSNKSVGPHIGLSACTNIEIKNNYLHHAFTYDGSGARGYGVMLFHHTGECLVSNNIFEHLRHSMSLKQGANGNVVSYNYSFDGYRSEFPNGFAADISMHGHYAFANLLEGNTVGLLWIDDYWGPSGPFNTYFRNHLTGFGLFTSSPLSNQQHFVGNDISNPQLLEGLYVIVGDNHIEYGNNHKGTIKPSGTEVLNEASYYLSEAPNFWNSTIAWPNIGYPNAPNSSPIPAQERYNNGQFSLCEERNPPKRFYAQLLLAGAYNTSNNNMTTLLAANNLLPMQQPYQGLPVNYAGGEQLQSLPTNIVDWVLVELRSPAYPYTIIEQRAALVASDGRLVDMDGNDGVAFFEAAASENYRLAVRPRQHLGVLSSQTLSLPNTTPYNFTDTSMVWYGSKQLVAVASGIYALKSGDVNMDGVVSYADYNAIVNDSMFNNGSSLAAYSNADLNLDGLVNNSDLDLFNVYAASIGLIR